MARYGVHQKEKEKTRKEFHISLVSVTTDGIPRAAAGACRRQIAFC